MEFIIHTKNCTKGRWKRGGNTLTLGLRNHPTSHSIFPSYSCFSPILKWSTFNNWDGDPPFPVSLTAIRVLWCWFIMLQTASCRNTTHLSTPINQKEILWMTLNWQGPQHYHSKESYKSKNRFDFTLSLALGTAIFLVSQTGTPKLSGVLAIYPLPFEGQILVGIGP